MNPCFDIGLKSNTMKVDLETIVFQEKEEQEATVFLSIKINADEVDYKNMEDMSDDIPFVSNLVMNGVFFWDDDFTEEQIHELLKQTAPTLLLSYARPIFGNLISNARLPNMQIPFINMNDNKVKFMNYDE
ncbi:MAG: protein-export chaperone SecB [Anaerostipes sp.]|nr:protein-export chaperone SecB [Anaerostipes sp.]